MLVKLKISNPDNGTQPIEVDDAVVDTGSVNTVLLRDLAVRLGLKKTGTRDVLTASGPETLDTTYAFLQLQGKETMMPLLVSNTLPQAIIGVTLLEVLGFIVDPVPEELRDADILFL